MRLASFSSGVGVGNSRTRGKRARCMGGLLPKARTGCNVPHPDVSDNAAGRRCHARVTDGAGDPSLELSGLMERPMHIMRRRGWEIVGAPGDAGGAGAGPPRARWPARGVGGRWRHAPRPASARHCRDKYVAWPRHHAGEVRDHLQQLLRVQRRQGPVARRRRVLKQRPWTISLEGDGQAATHHRDR